MNGFRRVLFFPSLFALVLALLPGIHADAEGYEVVAGWPELPQGFAFGEVAGVDVDSHNHVFVFHRGDAKPIIAFDGATGAYVHSFGEGLFKNAHGLEVDDEDNVWITDNGHQVVMKFSHDGELLLTVGEKGVKAWDKKHFNQPTDLIVTKNGEFYVSDGYVNSRVVKFSAKGKFLFEWGAKGKAPGEFVLPHGIAQDNEGRIYVADRSNKRIQVFDDKGKFLHQWTTEQLGESGRPWGLHFAPDGYLYVIDGGDVNPREPNSARATKLDLEGNVIATWGSYGPDPGQFMWGHDIAVGNDGAVYTAEVRYNNRVQKFVKK